MSRPPSIRAKLAADVLQHHFGKRPREVRRLHGGLANHVFEGKVGRQTLVVRISEDAAKLQTFIKEQWAIRKARGVGVPVPDVLEVGNTAIPYPYMIAVKELGQDATHWPDRLGIARAMGELAARINSIHTSGFGSVFDWSRNQLSRNKSWRHFLDDELKVNDRLDLIERHRLMRPTDFRRLQAQLRELKSWKGRPSLTHGDIRFKNVVLNPAGKICAVLDWENCTSNRAPHWELSIALHDLTIDEKEAFLDGYGLSPREFSKIASAVKTINILNYAEAIQSAAKEKTPAKLDFLRARLHGAFDLNSI